ncbi:TetR/AcrR family transcriptional regulator [Paenibacillus sp. UMB4589-SE434]|uniref:TetR/AcrR family transcriptional regulator n=1 Tax=Paenibacillus sp. UMB4589-SE434 TaxID=3046314 RepID=UPI00254A586E|nr:TetR/AcrR family transcriptional regulator [Paenibacillus sp. UMB4589-SE434]MDK8183022.1 TetR/AcrR family transcriptional regulator [Paenibacillus sp. UMB4589-SE434]
MSGIRTAKKEATRKLILEHAYDQFMQVGYGKVTTSKVAKAAGIGEGTLFNYFHSKGDLFVSAMFGDTVIQPYTLPDQSIHSIRELAAAITSIIDYYLSKIKSVNKDLLKDFFSVVYGSQASASTLTRSSLFKLDQFIISHIEQLLKSVMEEADHDLVLQPALTCIAACVTHQLSLYVLMDEYQYDDMLLAHQTGIEFVLQGNLSIRSTHKERGE